MNLKKNTPMTSGKNRIGDTVPYYYTALPSTSVFTWLHTNTYLQLVAKLSLITLINQAGENKQSMALFK